MGFGGCGHFLFLCHQYGMMTYLHGGEQYVVVQVQRPGRLVALKLPG